jgi:hypothetical protein
MTTVLESVQAFIKTFGSLKSGSPVLVDFLGSEPTQYSIVSLPGTRIVEQYLNGGSLREFPFAFQAMFSTADDAARIENSGFYEAFADWLETQTEAGVLPTMAAGKTAEKIEALGGAFLYEQGESDKGVYQIQCKLTYSQQP